MAKKEKEEEENKDKPIGLAGEIFVIIFCTLVSYWIAYGF